MKTFITRHNAVKRVMSENSGDHAVMAGCAVSLMIAGDELTDRFKKANEDFNDSLNGKFIKITDVVIYTPYEGEVFVEFLMVNLDDVVFMYPSADADNPSYWMFKMSSGQEIQGSSMRMLHAVNCKDGD